MGQTKVTGEAKTSGPCSPAVSGSEHTFIINCGINEKQGQAMVEILNKILTGQTDPNKEIEAQRAKDELSDIRAIVEATRKTVQLICNSASSPELQKECEQIGVNFQRSLSIRMGIKDSVNVQHNRTSNSSTK